MAAIDRTAHAFTLDDGRRIELFRRKIARGLLVSPEYVTRTPVYVIARLDGVERETPFVWLPSNTWSLIEGQVREWIDSSDPWSSA